MGQGNTRLYNLISVIFLVLTVLVVIFVVVKAIG